MDFLDFARAALACYFTFVAVFYTAKLLGLRHRHGLSYADPGTSGTIQSVTHHLFYGFRFAIWMVCVARVVYPGLDRFLVPLPNLQTTPVIALGLAFLMISLALVIYIQNYMGEVWRSGVPTRGVQDQTLLTKGPFAVSRHPLFFAVSLGQVGFFLSVPSVFSFLCLIAGLSVMVAQSRYEERHLLKRYGEAYRLYAAATPKWMPGLGAAYRALIAR